MEKILRSLTNDFENIFCVIEESKNLPTLSIEEFSRSLKAHKQRRKNNYQPLDQVLKIQLDVNEGTD